jgi:hypothetical protein
VRLNFNACGGSELFGDVAVGDGAEEATRLTNAGFERDGVALETIGDAASLGIELLLAASFLLSERVSALEVIGAGGTGHAAGEEEIACKAVLDVLDIANKRSAFHVLEKDDLHLGDLRFFVGRAGCAFWRRRSSNVVHLW